MLILISEADPRILKPMLTPRLPTQTPPPEPARRKVRALKQLSIPRAPFCLRQGGTVLLCNLRQPVLIRTNPH